MAQKLRAARDAATDPDLVLIARTDALAVEGVDAAIERGLAYAEAGADVIFIEAPTTDAEIEAIARRVPQPKSSTCSRAARRRSYRSTASARSATGSRSSGSTSSARRSGEEDTLAAYRRDGSSRAVASRMATSIDREAVVGTAITWPRRRYKT